MFNLSMINEGFKKINSIISIFDSNYNTFISEEDSRQYFRFIRSFARYNSEYLLLNLIEEIYYGKTPGKFLSSNPLVSTAINIGSYNADKEIIKSCRGKEILLFSANLSINRIFKDIENLINNSCYNYSTRQWLIKTNKIIRDNIKRNIKDTEEYIEKIALHSN